MIVNSNPTAKLTQRYLHRATSSHADSMKKLASGSRINSAKDDAAGLQISNRLQTQRSGLNVAIQNAQNATSLTQVAEGALEEYSSMVMRIRELATQSANGSNTDDDRLALDQEVQALKKEMNRIVETTSFGGVKLLNGTTEDMSFQIGADSGEAINVTLPHLDRRLNLGYKEYAYGNYFHVGEWQTNEGDQVSFKELGVPNSPIYTVKFEKGLDLQGVADKINGSFDGQFKACVESINVPVDGKTVTAKSLNLITTKNHWVDIVTDKTQMAEITTVDGQTGTLFPYFWGMRSNITPESISVKSHRESQVSITACEQLLKIVDSERAKLGAVQNRLSHAVNNLSQSSENVAASNSRIRDTDFARETSRLAKESILKEANTAMLAQASKAPQEALNLLK